MPPNSSPRNLRRCFLRGWDGIRGRDGIPMELCEVELIWEKIGRSTSSHDELEVYLVSFLKQRTGSHGPQKVRWFLPFLKMVIETSSQTVNVYQRVYIYIYNCDFSTDLHGFDIWFGWKTGWFSRQSTNGESIFGESGNGMINQGMGEMGKCWEFQLLFFSNCKTSELDTWKYLEDQLLDRKWLVTIVIRC